MITLLLIAAFVLMSCVAAAGLIASAQNSHDDARNMTGLKPGGQHFGT